MEINIDERKEKALSLFKEGYNCAQSVFLAYADVFNVDEELVKTVAAPFGGGMGRLREVCGAASGMFMIMGFKYPHTDPNDKPSKTANYAAVQRTASVFKEKFGTLICADLLSIKRAPQNPEASDRNEEYYAKRPCARFVAEAAVIVGKELMSSK